MLKANPEDFVVVEQLGFELDDKGEHILVNIRETSCTTKFVADHLVRFSSIHARSIGYAGLKDHHAVTEQWFCLHLPGKKTLDFSQFLLEGCKMLACCARHLRKNAHQHVERQCLYAADIASNFQSIVMTLNAVSERFHAAVCQTTSVANISVAVAITW